MTGIQIIGMDHVTVANWAQQLECRCDPLFIAQDIRTALNAPKPVDNPALANALASVLRKLGQHQHDPKGRGRCEVCEVLDVFDRLRGKK